MTTLKLYDTYAWPPVHHLVGPTGPRGGAYSLCGKLRKKNGVQDVVFPRNAGSPTFRNVCPECKQKALELANE